jgi:ABC-type branched-subunit amino acid transport system substrate-binding protein
VSDVFDPVDPATRLRRRRRTIAVVLGLVAVLAAASVWVVIRQLRSCGDGVTELDGECVGVTDGSYVFDPRLADLHRRIERANDEIDGKPAVTVALVNSFTPDDTSALGIEEVRHTLQGAVLAQRYANSDEAGLGLRIRLVLANQGAHQDGWEQVGEQLIDMTDDEDAPLVAVAGMGVSTTRTLRAAQQLSAAGIPMVGAITTADQLNSDAIPGYMRVSPTNADYVQALRQYLSVRKLTTGILVVDSNSDTPNNDDIFTKSLRDDIDAEFADGIIKYPPQYFVGSLAGRSEIRSSTFRGITSRICAVEPSVVFYAGRQNDLVTLLTALRGRVCADLPLTVVTAGSDLGGLTGDAPALRAAKLTVAYASATDPTGWPRTVPGTPPDFADFLAAFTGAGFAAGDLADGNAIATHDALFAVTEAVALTVQDRTGDDKPTSGDVASSLLNLNGPDCVRGAGGTIGFGDRPDPGRPIGKAIPVLEIPPTTGPQAQPYRTAGSSGQKFCD